MPNVTLSVVEGFLYLRCVKKICILICTIYFYSPVIGQNRFPLPSDNAFWVEWNGFWDPYLATNPCGSSGGPGCTDVGRWFARCPIYFGNDTLIDSVSYNRLYSHCLVDWIAGYDSPPPCFNHVQCTYGEGLYAIIKNDTLNNKVYIYENDTDLLLYDFNLSVGQVYPNTYAISNTDSSLFVASIDSILIDSSFIKVLHLESISYLDSSLIVIEGMGSNYGLKRVSDWPPHMDSGSALICFSRNGERIYYNPYYSNDECDISLNIQDIISNEEVLKIYPNPATTQLTIESEPASPVGRAVEIYDAMGQLVFQSSITNQKSTIRVESFSKGLYLIKVLSADGTLVKKLILE